MAETKDKPLTVLIKRRLKEGEMEQLRQSGSDLTVLPKERLEIKLDKLIGGRDG